MKSCMVADFGVLFVHNEGYSIRHPIEHEFIADPRDGLGRGFLVL